MLILLGLLQAGFIVSFVSHSVIIGFITSAAFTIPVGQLKKFFAVHPESEHFFVQIYEIFDEVIHGEPNWVDFGVGCGSIGILVLFQLGRTYLGDNPKVPVVLRKFFWFMGTTRSAMVVIIMGRV